mmetsp:Transcript_13190/g.36421  ORF Transcript_13190/g.36421 Transcript_13190/m.36421 type:complete len:218 (-) Transcript_13190:421-1074(-)
MRRRERSASSVYSLVSFGIDFLRSLANSSSSSFLMSLEAERKLSSSTATLTCRRIHSTINRKLQTYSTFMRFMVPSGFSSLRPAMGGPMTILKSVMTATLKRENSSESTSLNRFTPMMAYMHIATNIITKAFKTGTMDLLRAMMICLTLLIRPKSLTTRKARRSRMRLLGTGTLPSDSSDMETMKRSNRHQLSLTNRVQRLLARLTSSSKVKMAVNE